LRYHFHEGVITAPDHLIDRTVNMLISPDGTGLSVVVSRDRLQAGEALEQFIRRQMIDLSRQVSKLEEVGRADAIAGAAGAHQLMGVQIASRFKQHGQQAHQLQAIFVLPDGEKVLILTATSLAPHTNAEKAIWQELLSTFELRAA
jgi:hypothetical protein